MSKRQAHDQRVSQRHESVSGQDQPAIRLAGEARDRGFDVASFLNFNRCRLDAERARRRRDRRHEEFRLR
jgi:hypothetical protein